MKKAYQTVACALALISSFTAIQAAADSGKKKLSEEALEVLLKKTLHIISDVSTEEKRLKLETYFIKAQKNIEKLDSNSRARVEQILFPIIIHALESTREKASVLEVPLKEDVEAYVSVVAEEECPPQGFSEAVESLLPAKKADTSWICRIS